MSSPCSAIGFGAHHQAAKAKDLDPWVNPNRLLLLQGYKSGSHAQVPSNSQRSDLQIEGTQTSVRREQGGKPRYQMA